MITYHYKLSEFDLVTTMIKNFEDLFYNSMKRSVRSVPRISARQWHIPQQTRYKWDKSGKLSN